MYSVTLVSPRVEDKRAVCAGGVIQGDPVRALSQPEVELFIIIPGFTELYNDHI
jgi:hypothetical protein